MKLKIIFCLFLINFSFLFSENIKDSYIDVIFKIFNKEFVSNDFVYNIYVQNRLDLCKYDIKIGDKVTFPLNEKMVISAYNKANDYNYLLLINSQKISYFKPFPSDYNEIFEKYGFFVIKGVKSFDLVKNTTILEFENFSRFQSGKVEKKEIELEKPVIKILYTPSYENLRFRNGPGEKGIFLRTLDKGEILEFIEKGITETIKGVEGTWIKVKSLKNNDTGWCFDAYLIQINK